MYIWACHNIHVDAKGQLVEVLSAFHHVGPGDRPQVIRPGDRYLYLLSHQLQQGQGPPRENEFV